MRIRREPKPPPPRNVTIGVRVRQTEYDSLQRVAYDKGLLVSEWARGVLLKELQNGK